MGGRSTRRLTGEMAAIFGTENARVHPPACFLLRPAPDDMLEAIQVGPSVNSAPRQVREPIEAVGPVFAV